jgi:polysaccharide deacetylase family protein (PEP-CTERM system associated)
MLNALTIDVEEYFHPNAMDDAVTPAQWDALPHRVEANTHRVLDLLSEHGVRATFFVLGWVAERWPSLVQEIGRRGHEVACHGHAHRLVYKLGPEAFRADAARGKRVLEDCLGASVAGYRAASYSIVGSTTWALDILVEEGFTYDSSIFPIRHHDIYGMPEFSRFPVRVRCPAGEILEIPPSTVRVFGKNCPVGGGGYFRLLPYAVTRWSFRRIARRDGRPAMVYLHPWEFDVEQPRLSAKATSRFRQYTNLRATEPRLRRLLRDFRFAPIRDVLREHPVTAPAMDVVALCRVGATSRRYAGASRTYDDGSMRVPSPTGRGTG